MLALGTRLWLSIEHAVGSSLVTMFKMAMYPLSLCPTVTINNHLQLFTLISENEQKGLYCRARNSVHWNTDWNGYVAYMKFLWNIFDWLLTWSAGRKGERRISHGTILGKLSQLQRDIEVTLQVHYRSKKKPYSGVLFRVKLTVGQLLQALQTGSEQNLITKVDGSKKTL